MPNFAKMKFNNINRCYGDIYQCNLQTSSRIVTFNFLAKIALRVNQWHCIYYFLDGADKVINNLYQIILAVENYGQYTFSIVSNSFPSTNHNFLFYFSFKENISIYDIKIYFCQSQNINVYTTNINKKLLKRIFQNLYIHYQSQAEMTYQCNVNVFVQNSRPAVHLIIDNEETLHSSLQMALRGNSRGVIPTLAERYGNLMPCSVV